MSSFSSYILAITNLVPPTLREWLGIEEDNNNSNTSSSSSSSSILANTNLEPPTLRELLGIEEDNNTNNNDNSIHLVPPTLRELLGIEDNDRTTNLSVYSQTIHENRPYDGDDEESVSEEASNNNNGNNGDDAFNNNNGNNGDDAFNNNNGNNGDDACQDDGEESLEELESMAGLLEGMRTVPEDNEEDLSGLDPNLKRRISDFRFAQKKRHEQYPKFSPFGIVGLMASLSDIRSDLRYAEHVAKGRRQTNIHTMSWAEYEKRRREKGFKRPFVGYLLVVVNVIMMIVAFGWSGWKIEPFNVNPLFGPNPEVLVELGALQPKEMIETRTWYRLITAIFLHAGIFHLVLNLGVLFLLSRVVERNHGHFQAAVLFLLPAIGGNIISGVMQPRYILLGASGGLFGLIGVLVADIVLNWKLMFLVFKQYRGRSGCWIRFNCIFWLIFDLFLNSIVGFTPFVDNFAHMGGMAYGFLMSLTILDRLPLSLFGTRSNISHKMKVYALRLLGMTSAFGLFVVTLGLLLHSDGLKSPCTTCLYISCVPFPFWGEDKWWRCDGCDAIDGQVFRNRGDGNFSDLALECPNGEITYVDIYDDQFSIPSEVEAALPEYCRNYC